MLNQRSKLKQTAAALKSVPSWNFTPWRSLKVQTLPSGSCSQLSARPPSSSAVPGLCCTSVSYICRIGRNDSPSSLKIGSKFFGSPAPAKTKVPPVLASPLCHRRGRSPHSRPRRPPGLQRPRGSRPFFSLLACISHLCHPPESTPVHDSVREREAMTRHTEAERAVRQSLSTRHQAPGLTPPRSTDKRDCHSRTTVAHVRKSPEHPKPAPAAGHPPSHRPRSTTFPGVRRMPGRPTGRPVRRGPRHADSGGPWARWGRCPRDRRHPHGGIRAGPAALHPAYDRSSNPPLPGPMPPPPAE